MTDVNFDKLKVIFIDWYLTLTSVTFLNKLKVENHDLFRKFIEIIFEQDKTGWHYDWARGKLSKEDAAQKIAQAGIMPYDKVLQTFADCCSHQTIDYPEVLNIIGNLRRQGLKVVMATDNWDVFTDYTVPSLHLYQHFDDIISSNEIGYIKRDAPANDMLFFKAYMEKHHLKKDEVVLIDDADVNVETCRKCNIPFIQIENCYNTLCLLKNISQKKAA